MQSTAPSSLAERGREIESILGAGEPGQRASLARFVLSPVGSDPYSGSTQWGKLQLLDSVVRSVSGALAQIKNGTTMKISRWTVYPALAVIGTLLITAVPKVAAPESEQDYAVGGLSKRDREAIFAEVRRKFGVPEAIGQKRTAEVMEPVLGDQGP